MKHIKIGSAQYYRHCASFTRNSQLNMSTKHYMLPPEIIEHILGYLDTETLCTVTQVHPDWKELAYLVAKKRCYRDITKGELVDHQQRWVGGCRDSVNWPDLHDNWSTWKELGKDEDNIIEYLKYVPYKLEFEEVSCVAALGHFVAVGLASGVVKVYGEAGSRTKVFQNLEDNQDEVLKIHFIPDPTFISIPIYLMVVYEDTIYIDDFQNVLALVVCETPFYSKSFSAYKNLFAVVTKEQLLLIIRVSTEKICESNIQDIIFSLHLSQCAANPTSRVLKTELSEDICCVLIDDTLKKIYYNKPIQNACEDSLCIDTKLDISIQGENNCRQYAWIFHNEIVINAYYSTNLEEEVLQMVYLGGKNQTRCMKCFNVWNFFGALVYVIFLHGSTLVFGLSNGSIYFYNVKAWEQFDVKDWSHHVAQPWNLGPIRCIDVVEKTGELIFYVGGNKQIYKIDILKELFVERPHKRFFKPQNWRYFTI